MVSNSVHYLNQIASFLKVQGGKINVNDELQPTRVASKSTTSGYLNIILQLLRESNSDLNDCNELEKAEIRQWIEYTLVYATQTDNNSNAPQILKELNNILTTRTYLVSHKLTIADVFLYYVLQAVMENLTILEKEKYLNISRWFDNLQQDSAIRQSNKIVDFSTNYLISVAPSRH